MLSKSRVVQVLSEFTDFVVEDDIRGSIITNIKKEYFSSVRYELRKFNCKLIHKSSLDGSDSFTLVFTVSD